MLRLVRWLLGLWVLVVLQTTLVPGIQLAGARPDLPFLLVVLAALHEGAAAGALAGFAAGLFVDLNSPSWLGRTSLAGALAAFAVGSVADRLTRGPGTRVAVAFAAAVARDLLLAFAADPGGIGRELVRAILPGGLYTAALAVPVMGLGEWIVGWGREARRGRR